MHGVYIYEKKSNNILEQWWCNRNFHVREKQKNSMLRKKLGDNSGIARLYSCGQQNRPRLNYTPKRLKVSERNA